MARGSLSKTLAVVIATFGLLILPDALFRWTGYEVTSIFKWEALITVAVLATMMTLLSSVRARSVVIVIIVIGQFIWLSCLSYFGAVLSPEQLMLVRTEIRDTALGINTAPQLLVPALVFSAIVAAGLWFLHVRHSNLSIWRNQSASLILLIVLIGLSSRGAFIGDAVAALPGLHTESALGTYRTAFSALRSSLISTKAPPGRKIYSPQIKKAGLPEEPVTVVVIMGESINPTRLSFFGAPANTTPNLHAWLIKPPLGLTLFARIGFSGGMSTRASVTSFLRFSSIPAEGEQRGVNIFRLAQKSGFKSWVFSTQSQKFVSAAGGASGVELIKTRDGNEAIIGEKKDDYLVDLVRSSSADDAPYQFFFLHQRTNHIPYLDNCSHLQNTLNIFSVDSKRSVKDKSAKGAELRASYDDGLRCWDRNVAALVSEFAKRRGAIHIFITADHSELMGEEGLFGHLHPTLRCAAVPFILLTNRPGSAAANQFLDLSPPSFYNLSKVVAMALGYEVDTPLADGEIFYINKTLAFGVSGYLEVLEISPWQFAVTSFNRDGKAIDSRSVDLSEFRAAEDYARSVIGKANEPPKADVRDDAPGPDDSDD